MGSLFETDLFGAPTWDALLSVHGRTVNLAPAGGAPAAADVQAIVRSGPTQEGVYEDGKQKLYFATAVFRPGAIVGWTPSLDDEVTIDGVECAVAKLQRTSPVVEFVLYSTEPIRFGGHSGHIQR